MSEPHSFEGLLENATWLRALALQMLADRELADDAVQETWIAALREQPALANERSWLARVVRNFGLQRRRSEAARKQREELAARPERLPSTAETLSRAELHAKLVHAVLALDEPYRSTILWRYFEGLSAEQIATRAGIEPATVRSRVARARAKLRAALTERDGEPPERWLAALLPLEGVSTTAKIAGAGTLTGLGGILMGAKFAVGLIAAALVAAVFVWRGIDTADPGRPAGAELATDVEDRVAETSRVASGESGPTADVEESSSAALHAPLLRVQVVAQENGRPLAGLHVLVVSKDGTMGLPAVVTDSARGRLLDSSDASLMPRTDDAGWVEIDVVAGHDLVASVSPAEYGSVSLEVVALRAAERREVVLSIPTAEDITFYGRLVAAADERPITEGVVVVDHWGHELYPSRTTTQATRSDTDGLFRLSAASWRRDVASVAAPGFGPATFRVVRGHETPGQAFRIPLAASASVNARVVDAVGAPLAGATVSVKTSPFAFTLSQGLVDSQSTRPFEAVGTTNAAGGCSLIGLPPDVKLTLRAELVGHPPQAPSEPVTLGAGETRSIEFTIGGGATIFGRIVDQHERPVTEHLVWRKRATKPQRHLFNKHEDNEWDGRVAATVTDADGRFTFKSVPSGQWWIGPAALSESESRAANPSKVAPVGELVVVDTARTTQEHVLIRADRGLFITGRVVEPAGGAAQPTTVYAFPLFELHSWVAASTLDDGTFVLGPLAAGDWSLSADRAQNGIPNSEEVRVAAGESGVVLQLLSGGTVRGRVFGLQPNALEEAEVWITRRKPETGFGSFIDSDGRYEWDELPPGVYDIFARTREGMAGVRSGIVVKAGETIDEANVNLVRGAKLKIRIEGPADDYLVRLSQGELGLAFVWFDQGQEAVATVPAGLLRAELQRRPTRLDSGETLEAKSITLEVGAEGTLVFMTER